VKLRTSNFVRTFILIDRNKSLGPKSIKNFGKSSRRVEDYPIFLKAPIYRAHRAVIFAIAQLSLSLRAAFLARDSTYAMARYMLPPVRPSACPSVRHKGGSVKDG